MRLKECPCEGVLLRRAQQADDTQTNNTAGGVQGDVSHQHAQQSNDTQTNTTAGGVQETCRISNDENGYAACKQRARGNAGGNGRAPPAAAGPPLLARRPRGFAKHCFVTHNWGADGLGHRNHDRASRLNACLKELGADTWFNEEQMSGDIRAMVRDGIEESAVVVVCITQEYVRKVSERVKPDNCKYELQHSLSCKATNLLLPVVMEPAVGNPKTWTGELSALRGTLARDLSKDDASFDMNVELLAKDIARLIFIHGFKL